jgi:hypothetical protein
LVPKKRVAKLDSVQPAEPVREAASDNDSE